MSAIEPVEAGNSMPLEQVASPPPPVPGVVLDFIAALESDGFSGECASDQASRLVTATDNSIYQIMPQAVLHPRHGDDLKKIFAVANRPEYRALCFYPRGGGTSMNGQPLGPGIVVDTSRHMRAIIDFDAECGLVKVEPGVVRDALNTFLKPHGVFFAPNVSTSSRATIGGMVSNDSSGKGSVVHGKASDHIEALEIILPDGRELEITASSGATGNVPFLQIISDIIEPHHDEIDRVFPKLTREFTGYNLQRARDRDGRLHLTRLIAGSEGTLCMIKSITCRAIPLPVCTGLVAVRYPTHDAGMRAVPAILKTKPSAIEFIDGTIVAMAENSPFAGDMRAVLGAAPGDPKPGGVHFVEFQEDTQSALDQRMAALQDQLDKAIKEPNGPIGYQPAREAEQIARIWDMRKACQGLLGGLEQGTKSVAFVEDSVVPPENLADYVADLQKIFDAANIKVGMFGHADVGVVHVRPALDLTSEEHRLAVRAISDKVFALTQIHGGLLWGEHGKGLRSEFSPRVLGRQLYDVMRDIKQHFDPSNRMNPGKIATTRSPGAEIIRLDAPAMRGHFEQGVKPELADDFAKALRCNGNGACFNQAPDTPLCPSYKATGDRRYSPKGRSDLLREWIRLRSLKSPAPAELDTLSEQVFDSMATCLACKSCSGGGCLFRVDIPTMRSRFLNWYYQNKRRPLRDLAVSQLERLAPHLARAPGLINALQAFGPVRRLAARNFGLVDIPRVNRKRLAPALAKIQIPLLTHHQILSLPVADREKTIVIIQDMFTSFYDTDAVLAEAELISELGYKPVLLKYRPGGKPLHVQGYLDEFETVARDNASQFSTLAAAGFTMVGVDVSTTLMYGHEYEPVNQGFTAYQILQLSQWLVGLDLPKLKGQKSYRLLQHCSEKSLHPETTGQWENIFSKLGLKLNVVGTGCCGMAGVFGHETENQTMSRQLFDQSWQGAIDGANGDEIIATGYSCRSQVRRFSHTRIHSPAESLLAALRVG